MILAIRPKDNAVYHYRQTLPFRKMGVSFWKELLGENETKKKEDIANEMKAKGRIWTMKYVGNMKACQLILEMADYADCAVVVDIDDNVWRIPPDGAVAERFKVENVLAFSHLLQEADAITCSTKPLATFIDRYFQKEATVLPNLIDPNDWDDAPRKKNEKVRIGCIYSPTHREDFMEAIHALANVLERYKNKTEFVLFGAEEPPYPFPFKVEFHPTVPHAEYKKKLQSLNLDISIAPLRDNDFNQSKSNIKWLESTMAGAAFIGSKVYPYEMSVEHGKTGYTCNGRGQWEKHLTWLIENEENRNKLVQNARKIVQNVYMDTSPWEKFYENLLAKWTGNDRNE